EGLGGVRGFDDAVARLVEKTPFDFPNRRFVVDNEDHWLFGGWSHVNTHCPNVSAFNRRACVGRCPTSDVQLPLRPIPRSTHGNCRCSSDNSTRSCECIDILNAPRAKTSVPFLA